MLFTFLPTIAFAQTGSFSTTDLIYAIHTESRIDSLVIRTIPLSNVMSNQVRSLVQSDSVIWYGSIGKLTVLLNSENKLEHLQWDSYSADSNACNKAKEDFTDRFGIGTIDNEGIITFFRNGLCTSLHKDEEGKFTIFFIRCGGRK